LTRRNGRSDRSCRARAELAEGLPGEIDSIEALTRPQFRVKLRSSAYFPAGSGLGHVALGMPRPGGFAYRFETGPATRHEEQR